MRIDQMLHRMDEDCELVHIQRSSRVTMEYIKKLKLIRKFGNNEVYKGRHVLTNKMVLLREIKQNYNEGIPVSALREISLLKELQHPNIICLLNAIFVNPVGVVLLFEYIPMDLKTYIVHLPTNFQFPTVAIQSYLYQIVSGIAFCHQRRIFHRNLNPLNVLITRKGVIKITDFDTARPFALVQKKIYTHNVTVLWYRSPEILLGTSQYTPKIDIWSIGCIFAELFLRKPIFNGDSEIAQIRKIAEILGKPNKMTWPELNRMPYYFSGMSENTENRLKSVVKNAKNVEIHLMKQMFKLNPVDRISAKTIFDHPYFSNFNQNLRVPIVL